MSETIYPDGIPEIDDKVEVGGTSDDKKAVNLPDLVFVRQYLDRKIDADVFQVVNDAVNDALDDYYTDMGGYYSKIEADDTFYKKTDVDEIFYKKTDKVADAEHADGASRLNGLEIMQDANGVLRYTKTVPITMYLISQQSSADGRAIVRCAVLSSETYEVGATFRYQDDTAEVTEVISQTKNEYYISVDINGAFYPQIGKAISLTDYEVKDIVISQRELLWEAKDNTVSMAAFPNSFFTTGDILEAEYVEKNYDNEGALTSASIGWAKFKIDCTTPSGLEHKTIYSNAGTTFIPAETEGFISPAKIKKSSVGMGYTVSVYPPNDITFTTSGVTDIVTYEFADPTTPTVVGHTALYLNKIWKVIE